MRRGDEHDAFPGGHIMCVQRGTVSEGGYLASVSGDLADLGSIEESSMVEASGSPPPAAVVSAGASQIAMTYWFWQVRGDRVGGACQGCLLGEEWVLGGAAAAPESWNLVRTEKRARATRGGPTHACTLRALGLEDAEHSR